MKIMTDPVAQGGEDGGFEAGVLFARGQPGRIEGGHRQGALQMLRGLPEAGGLIGVIDVGPAPIGPEGLCPAVGLGEGGPFRIDGGPLEFPCPALECVEVGLGATGGVAEDGDEYDEPGEAMRFAT